jgi:hypothetical protein
MATVVESAQQKDNLCGPFWAARLIGGDEDEVALRAGTILPDPDDGSVPPGARSKTDYTVELPKGPPELSGTSAEGLMEAIEAAGVKVTPLRGQWTAERVVELLHSDAKLIANVRTGRFWASHPPVEAVLAELSGEEADVWPHEWDVGHFVQLERLIGDNMVLVHDSYPTLGWNGRHLQPARLVAAALNRNDGREGGVLALWGLTPKGSDPSSYGEVGLWNNGTPRR